MQPGLLGAATDEQGLVSSPATVPCHLCPLRPIEQDGQSLRLARIGPMTIGSSTRSSAWTSVQRPAFRGPTAHRPLRAHCGRV